MKRMLSILLLTLPMAAQGVRWEHTLASAQARAKAEQKVIFLDLWAEWCGPCQALKRNVFPSAEAQAALAKVVPLEVMVESRNGERHPEGVALATRYGLRAFPSLFLLDADGKVIRSQVGALSPEGLAKFLSVK